MIYRLQSSIAAGSTILLAGCLADDGRSATEMLAEHWSPTIWTRRTVHDGVGQGAHQ